LFETVTEEVSRMIERKHSPTKGLSKLLLVPVSIAVLTLTLVLLLPYLESYGVTLLLVIFVAVYPSALYVAWLFGIVHYSDTAVLDKVNIYGAPEEVANQLKTTNKNRLVTVRIILLLGSISRKPSQSEIVKYLTDMGIDLTATRIREILGGLEKMGLVSSSKPTYERQYWLTKKGQWCLAAAKYYFPKRNGLFVLRNEIIQKRFSPFPETNN
jgi:predicted transcriptional regulator